MGSVAPVLNIFTFENFCMFLIISGVWDKKWYYSFQSEMSEKGLRKINLLCWIYIYTSWGNPNSYYKKEWFNTFYCWLEPCDVTSLTAVAANWFGLVWT